MESYKDELRENPWRFLEGDGNDDGLLSRAASLYAERLGAEGYTVEPRHIDLNSGTYKLDKNGESFRYEVHLVEAENVSAETDKEFPILEFRLEYGQETSFQNFMEAFRETAGFKKEDSFGLDDKHYFFLGDIHESEQESR